MHRLANTFYVLIAIVISIGLGELSNGKALGAPPLDICVVASNPLDYHQHIVRLTAFMRVGPEVTALYDPKCREGRPLISVEMAPKVKGEFKELRRLLNKKHYAFVTVEGTLHGPIPIVPDPSLPDWMKERMKGSVMGFGHLNAFNMEIEINNVIEVRDNVDDRIPVPSPK